jgi:hypothetical protein
MNSIMQTRTVPQSSSSPTSPKVMRVVERVRVLREYTRTTGFHTTRSQNQALQTLDGVDLADALILLGKE